MSDTGVILSKEVTTVRCEVILTNMCSSVLMEHGGTSCHKSQTPVCDSTYCCILTYNNSTQAGTECDAAGVINTFINNLAIQVYYNRYNR